MVSAVMGCLGAGKGSPGNVDGGGMLVSRNGIPAVSDPPREEPKNQPNVTREAEAEKNDHGHHGVRLMQTRIPAVFDASHGFAIETKALLALEIGERDGVHHGHKRKLMK